MEMPEGWKKLFTKKMIARANNWNDDVEVFENALNLMKEMAEALEITTEDTIISDLDGFYKAREVLNKFKSWK